MTSGDKVAPHTHLRKYIGNCQLLGWWWTKILTYCPTLAKIHIPSDYKITPHLIVLCKIIIITNADKREGMLVSHRKDPVFAITEGLCYFNPNEKKKKINKKYKIHDCREKCFTIMFYIMFYFYLLVCLYFHSLIMNKFINGEMGLQRQ